MTNKYHVNNSIRLTATFSVSGVSTDPTSVTLKVMNPAGVIESYSYGAGEITRSSAGVYYKEILSDSCGDWWYEWVGTGAVVAADEDGYIIEHSKFV